MANMWIKEFTGGLDTRRMPVTTSGGVLMKGNNGHISRGGEFEKRAAFVTTYTLPAGTVGLAATLASLYVFGSYVAPVMPTGVLYQRLQHPGGVIALTRVLSWDLYAGKIYAVGEFADGSIQHFYDGARVTDWFDGRARASFDVTGGAVVPAVAAHGSFDITGGTLGGGNQITGVSLIAAPVAHTGNNATTATAVASAINSHASTPDYSASATSAIVTITALTAGTAPNGANIVVTVGGTATTGNMVPMFGGVAATVSTLSDLKIDGVSIIGAPILWATSNEATATAIVAAINSFSSSPNYDATAVGAKVNLLATTPGAAANGRAVAFTLLNGLTVSPDTGLVLANGADSSTSFQPGTYVKTIGQKMNSVSGPITHFSGLQEPTKWTTDYVGAGFIDMSTQSSGTEKLVSLERYQNLVAVFAGRTIQIWFFDPDPTLNTLSQVLNNTGTSSPNSVTQFGDSDIFYLDESGLRSLRARDSSNAAATTDIGVSVDTLVTAKLQSLTETERSNVKGLIEPRSGRFWLIMKDTIFVFSYFSGSKVSAWTTYTPADTSRVEFNIDAAAVFSRRTYVRSGNTIYCYGGIGATEEFDDTVGEAWMPYLDAGSPTVKKNWTGVDAALEGQWEVYYAMSPTDESAEDKVGILSQTTYEGESVASLGESTHISPRFRTKGTGPAKLSAIVIHFQGGPDEN
jgi:hypothetical protein